MRELIMCFFSGVIAVLTYCFLESREPRPAPECPKWSTTELLRQQSPKELSDWDKMILAICWTESHFNPDAVGKNQDSGIMQITPIYVKEVNRVSGANFRHEDAFDIDSSLAMFDLMQQAKNPQRDIDTAIYFHNKSAGYRKVVLENMAMVERYEKVRSRLIKD